MKINYRQLSLASSIFEEESELDSSEEFEPLESLLDDCIAIEPVFQKNKSFGIIEARMNV